VSGKPTDWSTARYVCPSGDPPNSQGQCTTTTVVGQSTCPPGIPLFGTTGLCAFNIITPPCPAGIIPGFFLLFVYQMRTEAGRMYVALVVLIPPLKTAK